MGLPIQRKVQNEINQKSGTKICKFLKDITHQRNRWRSGEYKRYAESVLEDGWTTFKWQIGNSGDADRRMYVPMDKGSNLEIIETGEDPRRNALEIVWKDELVNGRKGTRRTIQLLSSIITKKTDQGEYLSLLGQYHEVFENSRTTAY